MKNKLVLIVAIAAGLSSAAYAEPIEWGGHYYELVSAGGTWDEAKTAAEGLNYNGYIGHLATITSEAEFDFLKTMPGLGDWNITWIGGHKVGTDYVWVNDEGIMDFSEWSSSPWESGQPDGNTGVAITGSGYGSSLRSQFGDCGEYIVEYAAAVPEPAGAMLIGCGVALIGLYRRCYGRD